MYQKVAPLIKPLPAIKAAGSDRFWYGSEGWLSSGIPVCEKESLREILFPHQVRSERVKQLGPAQHREITESREWLAAQLSHYGISFQSAASKEVLLANLESAFQGKEASAELSSRGGSSIGENKNLLLVV